MPWQIQQQKSLIRGSIETGRGPVMHWVAAPGYGTHATRLDAMRAFVVGLDPDFAGATDQLIRRQWRAWARWFGARTVVAP